MPRLEIANYPKSYKVFPLRFQTLYQSPYTHPYTLYPFQANSIDGNLNPVNTPRYYLPNFTSQIPAQGCPIPRVFSTRTDNPKNLPLC